MAVPDTSSSLPLEAPLLWSEPHSGRSELSAATTYIRALGSQHQAGTLTLSALCRFEACETEL